MAINLTAKSWTHIGDGEEQEIVPMKRSFDFTIIVLMVWWGIACNPTTAEKKKPRAVDNNTYTLAFGGDFTLGRWLNEALFDGAQKKQILAEIAPFFIEADIAVINGEGVISSGGAYFDKGEPRPFMYRAHPLAVDVLKDAGIDVVTVGNNHFGDYGRGAMMEMLHRLRKGGIDYTGGGVNLRDAETPAYVRVGDVVVAVVGGDFTWGGRFAARHNRPGLVHYNAFYPEKFEDKIVERLQKTLRNARKHAHVVLLTPHWGENWLTAPTPSIRRLAKRITAVGYDGILGHSAHVFQGVELIDGKPVIYDAGNLVSDLSLGGNRKYGFVWRLSFNRTGIISAQAIPVQLLKNKTVWIRDGKDQKRVLALAQKLVQQSEALGTKLHLKKNHAFLECTPQNHAPPPSPNKIPKRPVPQKVRLEPSDTIVNALPPTATPVNVQYSEGITLVGYELITHKISVPKGGQIIQTYWSTQQKIHGDYRIHLHARHFPGEGKSFRTATEQHIPGDWLLPTYRWPVEKIIRDRNLLRLKFVPKGNISFYVSLAQKNKQLNPQKSSVSLENGHLVPIGTAKYDKTAKRLFDYLKDYRKNAKKNN